MINSIYPTMGIQDFYKLFPTKYAVNVEKNLKGFTLAVDAMVELHRSALGMKSIKGLTDSNGNPTVHINVVLSNILKFISSKINQVWIFDRRSDVLKDETRSKRELVKKKAEEKHSATQSEDEKIKYEKQSFRISQQMIDDAKFILDSFNIPWIDAPDGYEAEEVGAWLTIEGTADYVLTSDSDALIFGAQGIIRKDTKSKKYLVYELEDILADNNISLEDLRKIAVILGSDFAPKTRGIGWKTVMKKYSNINLTDRQQQALNIFSRKSHDIDNLSWNNQQHFRKPVVISDPKVNKLKKWLRSKNFDIDRIDKLIKRRTNAGKNKKTEIPVSQAGKDSAGAANNGHKNAFMWLIFGGDKYVPGIIVSVWSVKRKLIDSKNRPDLVVMVTDDVGEKSIEIISKVADVVKKVEYIDSKTLALPTLKQRETYSQFQDRLFTKWRCLEFTEYDKIFFLDADVVAVADLEHIFDLETPAGTFTSPYMKPIGNMRNPYLKKGKYKKTGEKVPVGEIENALEGYSSVLFATSILLEPNKEMYHLMIKILAENIPFGFENVGSAPDEQLITYLYSIDKRGPKTPWTNIHQSYNYVPWYPKWLDGELPKIVHYLNKNTKPWNMKRDAWEDAELWYSLFDEMYDTVYALNYTSNDLGVKPNLNTGQKRVCFLCKQLKKNHMHNPLECRLMGN